MNVIWTFFCWTRTKTRNIILRLLGLELPTIKKGTFEIPYEVNDSFYAVVAKTNRKILLPFRAFSKDKDVTKEIVKFAGLHRNFHGIPTTPSMLGFLELRIESSKGSSVFFENEQIELPSK